MVSKLVLIQGKRICSLNFEEISRKQKVSTSEMSPPLEYGHAWIPGANSQEILDWMQ